MESRAHEDSVFTINSLQLAFPRPVQYYQSATSGWYADRITILTEIHAYNINIIWDTLSAGETR